MGGAGGGRVRGLAFFMNYLVLILGVPAVAWLTGKTLAKAVGSGAGVQASAGQARGYAVPGKGAVPPAAKILGFQRVRRLPGDAGSAGGSSGGGSTSTAPSVRPRLSIQLKP